MDKAKMRWRRAMVIAVTIVGVAAWRYESRSAAQSKRPADSASSAVAQSASSSALPSSAAAQSLASSLGPAERSLDVDALRRQLAGRPDAEAEVRRVVAFARFRDSIAAYGSGKDHMSDAERSRLARAILAELPEHVARDEILPIEAQALTAALMNDAEPDPAARAIELEAARRQWDAYSRRSVGPSPAADPRYQAYARQSREIVQQVQASVPDPRQQQIVIAQRLQALRVQLFDHASSSDSQ